MTRMIERRTDPVPVPSHAVGRKGVRGASRREIQTEAFPRRVGRRSYFRSVIRTDAMIRVGLRCQRSWHGVNLLR